MAYDGDKRRVRAVIFRGKGAPQCGWDAERFEKVPGHDHSVYPLRKVLARDIERGVCPTGEVLEDAVLLAAIQERSGRVSRPLPVRVLVRYGD